MSRSPERQSDQQQTENAPRDKSKHFTWVGGGGGGKYASFVSFANTTTFLYTHNTSVGDPYHFDLDPTQDPDTT